MLSKEEGIRRAEEYYFQCRREQMRARTIHLDLDDPQEYKEIRKRTKAALRKLEELKNVEVPTNATNSDDEKCVSAKEEEQF